MTAYYCTRHIIMQTKILIILSTCCGSEVTKYDQGEARKIDNS